MKSYDVTIQKKPPQKKYFNNGTIILFSMQF